MSAFFNPGWLTAAVTIVVQLLVVGYAWGQVDGKFTAINLQLAQLTRDLARNENDDKDRAGRNDDTIRQINLSIANMGQLRTDVEVMKNSLTSISEVLRRMERRFDPLPAAALVAPAIPSPPR